MSTPPRARSKQDSDATETAVPEVMPVGMANRANGEVDIPQSVGATFDDDSLREIASFDDALALLAENDTPVVDASQVMGNGFAILNDKSILQGVKILLLGWRFNNGDKGTFASVYVVAQMPGMNVPAKFVLNDGSTGICKQLIEYSKKTGRFGGLLVKNGVRRSDYDYTAADGSTSAATTFYLDLSA